MFFSRVILIFLIKLLILVVLDSEFFLKFLGRNDKLKKKLSTFV